MSEKQKLAEIEKMKENLITKMNMSKLKGGMTHSLIRGCCTQGCCEETKELSIG